MPSLVERRLYAPTRSFRLGPRAQLYLRGPLGGVVHGGLELLDLRKLLEALVQQVDGVVDQHVDEADVEPGVGHSQLHPRRLVRGDGPEVLEKLADVVADVELVVELRVAAGELDVHVQRQQVRHQMRQRAHVRALKQPHLPPRPRPSNPAEYALARGGGRTQPRHECRRTTHRRSSQPRNEARTST
eukprot:1078970-Prorocentrum_minimum.AAC.1